MDKNAEDLVRRPLYLYDIPPQILVNLKLKDSLDSSTLRDTNTPTQATLSRAPTPDSAKESVVGSQSCSLCSETFTSVEEQRSHLKSDLHHYNLKQKLRGGRPATEAEFEELIGNLDESLSGSDTSDSEDGDDRKDSTLSALLRKQATLANRANTREQDRHAEDEDEDIGSRRKGGTPPILWFESPLLPKNTYFGVYRNILTTEELQDESKAVEAIKAKQLAPIAQPQPAKDGTLPPAAYKGPHIFLCMIGGGHFAAMVVSLAPRKTKHATSGPMNREATVLAHKTFHRYTTRRKQGGSQSANDNSKGNAHSAGASLRRYNEQALVDDVRALLKDWKALLDTSELLFIRATGTTNRRTLFGPYEEQVLRSNDSRIRGFPFSTRRATQNELMRAFIELTRLKVREIVPVEERPPQTEASLAKAKAGPPKPSKPALSEEEETALLHTTQIQALIRRSKVPGLLSYLNSNGLSPDFLFQPPDLNHHAPTPLHFAAAQNSAPVVLGLISRGGADPTIENEEGKTAFELAGDRPTRDAFRVARSEAGDKWDWDAARIPTAITKEEADRRGERERKEEEQRESERRRTEEARLQAAEPKVTTGGKKKAGMMTTVASQRSPEERRMEETRGLTAEMRMKLERERRARAAEERLKRMQQSG